MAWWGWIVVVVVLVACGWAWNHFSLFGRLDRGTGRDDDESRAAREAMRVIDEGRSARRMNPPLPPGF